jgi:hypothetical protein
VEVLLDLFLTLTLDGSEWWTSEFGLFTAGKEPRYEMKRGLFVPQNRPNRFGKEKNP